MLRPSYAELMDIMSKNSEKDVTSRYTVVIAAAKRARQLIDGDETMANVSVDLNKPVSTAVEEIREGKIVVVPEGEGTKLKPKKTKDDESMIKKELEGHKAAEKEEEATDTDESFEALYEAQEDSEDINSEDNEGADFELSADDTDEEE